MKKLLRFQVRVVPGPVPVDLWAEEGTTIGDALALTGHNAEGRVVRFTGERWREPLNLNDDIREGDEIIITWPMKGDGPR